MCPQSPSFNRGYGSKLERYVRNLTKTYQNVYVVTGPLYLSHEGCDEKRYIIYPVIGPQEVAIPTHF